MHPIDYLLGLCVISPLLACATETAHSDSNVKQPHTATGRLQSRLNRKPFAGSQLSRHPRRSDTSTCPSNYDQCGNGLPDSFCCPSDSSCLALADNTTVLCCPDGEDCSSIQAASFTCDITAYNATAFPTAIVHTTDLTGHLPTCGSYCCPFGYSCSGGTRCVRDDDDTLITATSTSSTAAVTNAASATGTGLVVASSSVSAPTASSQPGSGSSSSSSKSRTIGIATGSAVAGLVGITAIIAFTWVRRKRRAVGKEAMRELPRSTREKPEPAPPVADGQPWPPPQSPNTTPLPPPLPRKNSVRPPKTKRKSLLSWVPSIVNRTPAELPATPVSFSHWGQLERPNEVYRPYPRDSLREDEIYELEARWLPQDGHA